MFVCAIQYQIYPHLHVVVITTGTVVLRKELEQKKKKSKMYDTGKNILKLSNFIMKTNMQERNKTRADIMKVGISLTDEQQRDFPTDFTYIKSTTHR